MILSIYVNRELIWEMAVKDLKGTNKGAFLGSAWVLLNPFIQTAAYVIIVSYVFQSQMPTGNDSRFDYALYVLSGMIPWQIMTYSIMAAPSLVRERIDLVKQVIYPIETLPLTNLIVGAIGAMVSLAIYMLTVVAIGAASWTLVWLPLPFIILALFVLGVSWTCMIIGVLVKDLREIVAVVMNLMVFVSPVVASESLVGTERWHYIQLNPLSHVVICFRDVFHAEFHQWSWIIFIAISSITFVLGSLIMLRTKTLINEYI